MKAKIKQVFSHIRRPFLLLFLPTILILAALIARENWPGLPQGVHRKSWLTAGDFSIVAYTDRQGNRYLDLCLTQDGRQRVLVNRVYAYRLDKDTLYVKGVSGAAAAHWQEGTCRLYTGKHYPRYAKAWSGVTLVHDLRLFPLAEYNKLISLTPQYQAFPAAPCVAPFGSGRFRIEEVTGQDGFRRLQLVDVQARELNIGYTVRLLRDVESFLILDGVLYARSKEGYARLQLEGEQYLMCYHDYGSKIYFSTLPDIQVERDFSSLSPSQQEILENLPAAGRS